MLEQNIATKGSALLLAAAAMLALPACSRQGDDQQGEDAPAHAQADLASATPTAPSVAPATGVATEPSVTGTIPAALRGRWGLVPADCTSTHGDAKGLMEVGATTLTFYESRATLKSIRTVQPDRVRADYTFSGEGQEWTLDVDLRSWNDGAQLIRQDRGTDALPGPLTYTRCAG